MCTLQGCLSVALQFPRRSVLPRPRMLWVAQFPYFVGRGFGTVAVRSMRFHLEREATASARRRLLRSSSAKDLALLVEPDSVGLAPCCLRPRGAFATKAGTTGPVDATQFGTVVEQRAADLLLLMQVGGVSVPGEPPGLARHRLHRASCRVGRRACADSLGGHASRRSAAAGSNSFLDAPVRSPSTSILRTPVRDTFHVDRMCRKLVQCALVLEESALLCSSSAEVPSRRRHETSWHTIFAKDFANEFLCV